MKQAMDIWSSRVLRAAQRDVAVRMRMEIIRLIEWIDPLPAARFVIQSSGRRTVLEDLQAYAEEYGRRAGIQLWFEVESGRDVV